MSQKFLPLIALTLAFLGCQTASQPPVKMTGTSPAFTTISGKPISIGHIIHVNPDCSSKGYATVRVINAPANGRITTSTAVDFVFPRFPSNAPAAICNDIKIAGKRIVFTPNASFKGEDTAEIELISVNGEARSFKFNFAVR